MFSKQKYLYLFLLLFLNKVSIGQVDALLDSLKKTNTDSIKVNLLNDIAQYYQNSNIELAFDYVQQAEKLALKINYAKGYCNSCNVTGGVYYVKSDFTNAEEYFTKALECFQNNNEKEDIPRVYRNLAMIYDAQGQYNKSFEYYLKGLKTIEETGNKENMFGAYFGIGNFHLKHNKIEYAKKYLFLAYDIAKELNDKKLVVRCLNNIGNIEIDEGDFDNALGYFYKALQLNMEMGLKRGMAFNYGSIANVYKYQGKSTKALEKYLQARSIFNELGEQRHVMIANYNIGNLFYSNKEFKQAIDYLSLSKEQAIKLKDNDLYELSSKKLSEAYSENQDYYKAYLNVLIKDSLNQKSIAERNHQLVEELERKYENEKKEKELALLKQEKADLALKKGEQEKIRNYLIMGLMLLGGTGLYLGRKVRQKSKISKMLNLAVKERTFELEAQNEKMTLLLKEVHHRVKNNLQLISSLLNLQLHYEPNLSAEELAEKWKNKIKCMALIHDRLNNSLFLDNLSTKEYFSDLVQYIQGMYDSKHIKFTLNIEEHILSLDQMVPCGLAFNEILSNSLKHNNFSDGAGQVSISFSRQGDVYKLQVSDNGSGLPNEINPQSHSSLGLSLVFDLVDQLNGKIAFVNNNGTTVNLDFPLKK